MRTTDPIVGRHRVAALALIAGVLAAPAVLSSCEEHRGYDVAYYDGHAWNDTEEGFYVKWEGDTHRDHRDFNQRSADEQKEYWSWRQSHQ
jgi:hypothetical protein